MMTRLTAQQIMPRLYFLLDGVPSLPPSVTVALSLKKVSGKDRCQATAHGNLKAPFKFLCGSVYESCKIQKFAKHNFSQKLQVSYKNYGTGKGFYGIFFSSIQS